jgi:hypothetical protein
MSEDFPHDTLFKAAMSRPALAAAELRVVLGPELAARIDWSTLRVFAPFVPDFRYFVDDLTRVSHLELLNEREVDPITRLVLWVLRDGREGAGILERSDEFFALLT